MASDLISRKRLLNELGEVWGIPDDWDGGIDETCETGFTVIENQPTVDAVEVVHGEWTGLISEDFVCAEGFNTVMTEKQKGKCLEDFYHRTHCSICNCCFDDRDVKNWNYCPNCGSKMDGGKRDEM